MKSSKKSDNSSSGGIMNSLMGSMRKPSKQPSIDNLSRYASRISASSDRHSEKHPNESPTKSSSNGFFSRSRQSSETASMDSLSKVSTNASYNTPSTTFHNLSQSHAKKISGVGFRKAHRHTISDEFVLDPPDDPNEIEHMFTEVMQTRDFESLPEKAKAEMLNYSIERKWMLIRQQKLTEYKRQRLRELPDPRSPTKMKTQFQLQMQAQTEPINFITLLLNNSISVEQLKELEVYLTSEDLNWMKEFLNQDGAVCLCNVLNNLYKTKPLLLPATTVKSKLFTNVSESYESIIEKESRLFRCIKVIALSTISTDKIRSMMPLFIPVIFSGLFSPKAWVKKLATDIITHFSFTNSMSSSL